MTRSTAHISTMDRITLRHLREQRVSHIRRLQTIREREAIQAMRAGLEGE